MYRERLVLTQQRLLRSELFALKGMGNSTLTSKHSSSNGPVHEVWVYTVTSPPVTSLPQQPPFAVLNSYLRSSLYWAVSA
jgi:hypothetical protein